MSFKGYFKNGKANGKGTYKLPNGEDCVGQWVDNKFAGKESYTMENGNSYEGEFEEGMKSGIGVYKSI